MNLIKIFEDFDYRGKLLDIVSIYSEKIVNHGFDKKTSFRNM